MAKILALLDVPDIPGVSTDELAATVTQHLDHSSWLPGQSGSVYNLPNDMTVAVVNDDPAVALLFESAITGIDTRDDLTGHAVVSAVKDLAGVFTA